MEGIWYAHFTSGEMYGDGVAVLRDGLVQGGRSSPHILRFLSGRGFQFVRKCARQSLCGLRIASRSHSSDHIFLERISDWKFGKSNWPSRQQAGCSYLCRTAQG